ncbi:MAG TPA: hypothetical protein VHH09_02435 [Acidimicrobiales bacterium]|nr:hypothetical protein [Acidimicrobiales bacterium]
MTFLWRPASATGLGPLPGTEPQDAAKLVLDELPSFPHLPELPARGGGADATARTAALLVELHVELVVGRWRLVPRPTVEEREARELLARDVDAFELTARGYAGPVKVQLLGPWTLARQLELPGGEWSLSDLAAVADVAESLTEGLAAHVAELRQRVPGVSVVVAELDEAGLAQVVAGDVPTASGWARYPAVDQQIARDVLAGVLERVGGGSGVRLRGADAPVDLARRAGARFLSLAAGDLRPELEDQLGEALEGGLGLLAGLVPPADNGRTELAEMARPVRRLWSRLGLAPTLLPEAVVVTPAGALDGVAPEQATAVLRRCVALAGWLEEEYRTGG